MRLTHYYYASGRSLALNKPENQAATTFPSTTVGLRESLQRVSIGQVQTSFYRTADGNGRPRRRRMKKSKEGKGREGGEKERVYTRVDRTSGRRARRWAAWSVNIRVWQRRAGVVRARATICRPLKMSGALIETRARPEARTRVRHVAGRPARTRPPGIHISLPLAKLVYVLM